MFFIITLDTGKVLTIQKGGTNTDWYLIRNFKVYKRKFLHNKFLGNIIKMCVINSEGKKNAKSRRNRG